MSLFVSHLQRNSAGRGRTDGQTLQLKDFYWAHKHISLHGTRYSSEKVSRKVERIRNREGRNSGRLWCGVKRSPWPWIRWGLGQGRCASSVSPSWHGSGTPLVSLVSPEVSSRGLSYARTPLESWPPPSRTPSGTWWRPRRRLWQ